MFHATMRSAVEGARTLAQTDDLSRRIWQAHAAEAVTDDEAQGLAELLHARRSAIRETVVPVGIPLGRATLFPAKPYQRSPDRAESRERRRRLACSGPMPPALASRFTQGQLAALRIVGDEIARHGACGLALDAIAARAGVCRRLAQAAIRLAEADGLLTVQERRHQGRKNDPNVIRMLSREWLAWLRRGKPARDREEARARAAGGIGCKAIHPTDKGDPQRGVVDTEPSHRLPRGSGRPRPERPTRIEATGRTGRAMR